MDEQPLNEMPVYSTDINTFRIPNDLALKRAYDVYKPLKQTVELASEQDRTIFPEVFITNERLGTLADLCVAVIARTFGPHPIPIVARNPLQLQVHYDSVDVNVPLAQCYDILEERFWKRIVLTKHQDKTLAIKRNVNWKDIGVTLKYVELVEQCPAEYWPEEEMKDLALKVKEFVKEMHIKHLQSLRDHSFDKYFHSESDSTTDESSIEEDMESVITSSIEGDIGEEEEVKKTVSQLELETEIANKRAQRKIALQQLREAQELAREAGRERREARRADRQKPVKKSRKKRIPNNIFKIVVSDSEDDGEERIVDKRNKELLLRHTKKYNYPAKDCHHINLSFVQYFTNLETFTIEFLGPLQDRNFHTRHLNFSHNDIKRLAIGLSGLPKLKIFRLRNSRMDAEKLHVLCHALRKLQTLETIDFGYDQLQDDCGFAFRELFQKTKSLKNLELESNFLGAEVLTHIGAALNRYHVNELSYLGLARNPLTDEALHALISAVIGTKHIEKLNIRGVLNVTDKGLCCCLADELLRQHPALLKLDICGIEISAAVANEIIKALAKNYKIVEFSCCACELDEESEIDINVIVKRNQYISDTSYIRDPSHTVEEIKKWINRTRSPIFLKVLAEIECHKQCLQNRPEEFTPLTYLDSPAISQQSLLDFKSHMYEGHSQHYSLIETEVIGDAPQRFVYPCDDFDEQQVLEHVFRPGPQDRYYYFKTYKKKYSIKENVKNKSMI